MGKSDNTESSSNPKTADNQLSLSSKDAQNLEWYFSEGKSSFAHSVTGPMLTKAELYRYGSYRCYLCDTFPGIDEKTGEWCKRCKGTGYHPYEIYRGKDAITAFPTAEVVESRGYEPSEKVLQDYGRVSRRLDLVRSIAGKEAVAALEAYHGDSGARWGRTKHQRIFALFPLTPAGKKILAKAEKYENITLAPTEALGVQAELADIQPEKRRWIRDLMLEADYQAKELYQFAVNAWIQAGASLSKPKRNTTVKKKRQVEKWEPTPSSKEKGVTFESIKETVGTI